MKNRDTNPDLYTLSLPVPRKYIKPAPQGKFGSFVPHQVVTQMLLATVGPFDWELVQLLKGDSSGVIKRGKPDERLIELEDVIVGAVYRLTCYIDDTRVRIEEVGETDAYLKSNEGARLKHASSDALKRCAMRLGVAIQLWCKTGEEHLLPRVLKDEAERLVDADVDVVEVGGEELDDEHHTGGVITDPKPFKVSLHIPEQIDDMAGGPLPDLPDTAYPPGAEPIEVDQPKPMVETVNTTNSDDWNLLLATLEVLPTTKDTVEAWRAYAKQMTDLMVRTGCWRQPKEDTLKGLLKDELVIKVTEAHVAANRKAAANAPF